MSADLARVIEAAIGEGILPPGTSVAVESERPWPVILLTALGAWLAAIPLMASLFLLVGEDLFRGPAPYIIGGVMLAGSAALLRIKTLPLFVEQLAVPGLLTGGLALGIALFRDLPGKSGAAVMAAVALAVAFLVPRAWLRAVLGAAAAAFTVLAMGLDWNRLVPHSSLFGLLVVVGLWLSMQWLPRQLSLAVDQAAALGAVADGWVLAALAGLAFWSGMTFLAGASIDPFGGQLGSPGNKTFSAITQMASLLLAGSAAAWIANHWTSLRKGWSAAASAAVIGLAWLMPSLGAVLLILAVCATEGRWRLAAAAGVAAAWIIGAFYYQLAFPLATKALIMVGAGTLFGALAWFALRGSTLMQGAARMRADTPQARLGIAVCALAVLAVANIGIWQKETLIAEGKPVFVELGPVDPRSLMQGDYMRLAFRLPVNRFDQSRGGGAKRPRAVGKIDARGIATLDRLDDGSPLAPGEIAIELTPTGRGWTLVTDAWYFREGDASRWERAKYGEFRVAPDGRALLVGMRGPQLEPLLTP